MRFVEVDEQLLEVRTASRQDHLEGEDDKIQSAAVDVADLVALDVPAFSRDHHVGELLLPEQSAEDPQQVVLVVVPLEAVLLPRGGHSSRPAHRLHHLTSRVTTEGPERGQGRI